MARRLGASRVPDLAIERGDGSVVKVPLIAGFSVFVVDAIEEFRFHAANRSDSRSRLIAALPVRSPRGRMLHAIVPAWLSRSRILGEV
jgi:hypothetical protein